MVVEMQNSGGKYTSSPTCQQHVVLKAKSEAIWLRVVVLSINVYVGEGEVEKGERQRDRQTWKWSVWSVCIQMDS